MYQVAPYWLYNATPKVAAHARAGPCDDQHVSQVLNLEWEPHNLRWWKELRVAGAPLLCNVCMQASEALQGTEDLHVHDNPYFNRPTSRLATVAQIHMAHVLILAVR